MMRARTESSLTSYGLIRYRDYVCALVGTWQDCGNNCDQMIETVTFIPHESAEE